MVYDPRNESVIDMIHGKYDNLIFTKQSKGINSDISIFCFARSTMTLILAAVSSIPSAWIQKLNKIKQ